VPPGDSPLAAKYIIIIIIIITFPKIKERVQLITKIFKMCHNLVLGQTHTKDV